jgi:hypothetical protein
VFSSNQILFEAELPGLFGRLLESFGHLVQHISSLVLTFDRPYYTPNDTLLEHFRTLCSRAVLVRHLTIYTKIYELEHDKENEHLALNGIRPFCGLNLETAQVFMTNGDGYQSPKPSIVSLQHHAEKLLLSDEDQSGLIFSAAQFRAMQASKSERVSVPDGVISD